MKNLRKILYLFAGGIFVIGIAAVLLIYFYRNEIIQLFIKEANKYIETPVEVGEIKLDPWEQFPSVSIHLYNVRIDGSIPSFEQPLLQAENIFFSFSWFDLFRGHYRIRKMKILNAVAVLIDEPDGINNYTLFKPDTASEPDSGLSFDLNEVEFNDVAMQYRRDATGDIYALGFDNLIASFQIKDDKFFIKADGPVKTDSIIVNHRKYLADKSLNVKTRFTYSEHLDSLEIMESQIDLAGSGFEISGGYGFKNQILDLNFSGSNTDFQTLMSVLPEPYYSRLSPYRSKGNLYFNGFLSGKITSGENPKMEVIFGCHNASFYHPQYKKKVESVYLSGLFTNGNRQSRETSRLELKGIAGEFDGRPFNGTFILNNLENPFLDFELKGIFDLQALLEFFPAPKIKFANGQVDLDIQFSGNLQKIRKTGNLAKTRSSGDIYLRNVNFKLNNVKLPFTGFNGNFRFKDDALAISDFHGKVGSSDFRLNGLFRDVMKYFFLPDEKIIVEADLHSNYMNVDELLSGNLTGLQKNYQQKYSFAISPKLNVNFNCTIESLDFRRFQGSGIRGHLNINRQVAYSRSISVNALGGKIAIDGMVDAHRPNNIEVLTNTTLEGIFIDRLFYVFNNFNQSFLMDRHLKGQIFSKLNTYMVFDDKLHLESEKLASDISIKIRNGELNEFEPLQKLSKFVEEKSLARMRFTELNNEIKIKNRQIFLPEMQVSSNVSTIRISGTHTFDQNIKYHLMVPLKKFNRKDSDEAFGAIESDNYGNLNLFLKFVGTTSDYRILYDTKAVKEKIRDDLRKEGEELKEVFRNKGRETRKKVELSDENYFEF